MSTTHVVQQGECLFTIARRYGFSDWRSIYDYAANLDFRRRRPNPNIIYPGDQIEIPPREPLTLTLATGRTHKITVKLARAALRIDLQDARPLNYQLALGSLVKEGATGSAALIEEEVPPDLTEAELRLWPGEYASLAEAGDDGLVTTLAIGHLDPIDQVSGIQARLKNLGYYFGEVDGIRSDDVTRALLSFQEEHPPLVANGETDQATGIALIQAHGC